MKDKDFLLVDKQDSICTITINRPEKRNILDRTVISQLIDALKSAGDDGQTRVVVIRGADEKAFCAGYDITQLSDSKDSSRSDPLEELILAVEDCPVPVIAMIYGYCIGAGCGLAMACDLRLASESVKVGIPAAKVGVVYPPVSTLRLINLVGAAAAKEMLYTGRLIDAGKAKEIGMIDNVVPVKSLHKVTYELAREIAGNSPTSVRGTKKIIANLLDYQTTTNRVREEFLSLQKQAADDLKEGQKAFNEKRKPDFRKE